MAFQVELVERGDVICTLREDGGLNFYIVSESPSCKLVEVPGEVAEENQRRHKPREVV